MIDLSFCDAPIPGGTQRDGDRFSKFRDDEFRRRTRISRSLRVFGHRRRSLSSRVWRRDKVQSSSLATRAAGACSPPVTEGVHALSQTHPPSLPTKNHQLVVPTPNPSLSADTTSRNAAPSGIHTAGPPPQLQTRPAHRHSQASHARSAAPPSPDDATAGDRCAPSTAVFCGFPRLA